jgi:hypothetical protein
VLIQLFDGRDALFEAPGQEDPLENVAIAISQGLEGEATGSARMEEVVDEAFQGRRRGWDKNV